MVPFLRWADSKSRSHHYHLILLCVRNFPGSEYKHLKEGVWLANTWITLLTLTHLLLPDPMLDWEQRSGVRWMVVAGERSPWAWGPLREAGNLHLFPFTLDPPHARCWDLMWLWEIAYSVILIMAEDPDWENTHANDSGQRIYDNRTWSVTTTAPFPPLLLAQRKLRFLPKPMASNVPLSGAVCSNARLPASVRTHLRCPLFHSESLKNQVMVAEPLAMASFGRIDSVLIHVPFIYLHSYAGSARV